MRKHCPRLVVGAWLACLSLVVPLSSFGATEIALPDRFARDNMDCRVPVRLTRDCSNRKGPTRPIAIGAFRMNLAGSSDGRTLLISAIRFAPDHNGRLFSPDTDDRETAVAAIKALRRWLYDTGACLEHWQAVQHAGQTRAYLVTFSDPVYTELRRLTLLESEHWLPGRLTRR